MIDMLTATAKTSAEFIVDCNWSGSKACCGIDGASDVHAQLKLYGQMHMQLAVCPQSVDKSG